MDGRAISEKSMNNVKHILVVVFLLAVMVSINACSWAGETAGRAKAGMENAVKDTREGYNKGYEENKQK